MQAVERMETERLRLRRPAREDAPAIFERYACDPAVTRYLLFRPLTRLSEAEEFVKNCIQSWEQGSAYTWLIESRDTSRLLGAITARVEGHRVDLGYVLARDSWGQGYMTEAVKAVVSWAFAQPEVYRVQAYCDLDHSASRHVMEKAGMQREGVLRRWVVFPNLGDFPRDCTLYSIVRSEAKERLC